MIFSALCSHESELLLEGDYSGYFESFHYSALTDQSLSINTNTPSGLSHREASTLFFCIDCKRCE